MKRKTHEEYVKELAIKNPNIQVIGKYINAKTKITHKCLKHNICWDTTPSRALMGVGCEKCHMEKILKSITTSHEEYIQQVKKINPNIVPLEEFKGTNIPILHHCIKHDVIWKVLPSNILCGHGCVECGKEKTGNKNKKDFMEYERKLELIHPTIKCIKDYKNFTTPAFHKCEVCGYEWSSAPINVLKGVGCPRCMRYLKRDKEYYINELKQINPQIELVGEFINITTHTLHRCKIHNYCWNVIPASIISGTGCPICGKQKNVLKRTKKPEDFENELKLISPDIICLGKYSNALEKIEVKCSKCNNIWRALPSNLLRGSKCPNCNKSNGEDIISDWLRNNNIEYVPQKKFKGCKDKRLLPFDFYIPSKNIVIEYDGEQHFKPIDWFGGKKGFDYIQKHDQIKTQYCMDNNIKLFRISYEDDIPEKLNSLFI